MTYEEFVSQEGMPEAFKEFTVTFLIEGKEAAAFVCAYGDSIPPEEIPEIPEREGFYGRWQEFDLDCVTSSAVLEAIYERWTESLESSEKSEAGKPLLLVEGEFLPDWKIQFTDGEEKSFRILGEMKVHRYIPARLRSAFYGKRMRKVLS